MELGSSECALNSFEKWVCLIKFNVNISETTKAALTELGEDTNILVRYLKF